MNRSMGILDQFLSFAEQLKGERRQAFEAELAALMESYSDEHAFRPDELSELDRRVAEPHPQFASEEEVARIFGRRG
jgi:hypothetical protein